MYSIGGRLRECRLSNGLSRHEVAEMLHITIDYLARIETGMQPVTYRMIERMYKYTDWDSDYILHGIVNSNPFMKMYEKCPDNWKKVFIRNLLCLFDSMLQFGYKEERAVAYYHRMILEIVNGMELEVHNDVYTGYTFTEIRRIQDMDKSGMADMLGMTPRSYSALENGSSKPDVSVLHAMYTLYGFNTRYFLTRNPLECEAVCNIYRSLDDTLRSFIMKRIRDDYNEIIIMKGQTYGRDIQDRPTGAEYTGGYSGGMLD